MSTDRHFEYSDFACPKVFHWPGYMWILNSEMSEDVLSTQLSDMADHGALTVTPLPEPADFRPDTMPTLLSPDYLTPEYLERYRFLVRQARKRGMNVWLYDEGGWPSGSVCGRLVRENPELSAKALHLEEHHVPDGKAFDVPPGCLRAFLYRGSERQRILAPGAAFTCRGDGCRILVVGVSSVPGAPDLLNPESTQEFIRLTHDSYRKSVGVEFGKAISLLFTDEPWVALRPWTDDFAPSFRQAKGYDILEHLPSIFQGDAPEDKQVRIDYWDWWSERYAEAYFGQVQDWCHENGLLFGGHLDSDNTTEGPWQGGGVGHPLRDLRRIDVPGVDVIWRQMWPGETTHHWPKFASSVAHQDGKPWALSESFAVYGSGLTPGQMKWICDYQYVRGINLLTMIGYQLSTRDWFMAGERPGFGPSNPLWKHLTHCHSYVARLGYLLSIGRPEITTALYYPIRDIWVGGSDCEASVMSHNAIARALLDCQCDFDLVDDDTLSCATVETGGKLRIGEMIYDTICVPHTSWMTDQSRTTLSRFAAAGGKVLWFGDRGDRQLEGAVLNDLECMHLHVNPLVKVTPAQPKLRVCCRKTTDSSLYFITNETISALQCTVAFSETSAPVVLDAESGNCWRPTAAVRDHAGWSIPIQLDFAGSVIVMFAKQDLPTVPEPWQPAEDILRLEDGWTCRKVRSVFLAEHDIEVEDLVDHPLAAISLGDWADAMGNDFSGEAEYQLSFDCEPHIVEIAKLLSLGEVRYACEVELNGSGLGSKPWPPFSFNVAGRLSVGRNVLRIRVTNTLANQYCTSSVLDRWDQHHLGPYHPIALRFEADSLPSGLYGPVTLQSAQLSIRAGG